MYLTDIQPIRRTTAKARRHDVQTSHDAAEAAERGKVKQQRFDLKMQIIEAPGTASELAERTGMTQVQVCRRLCEIEGIERKGERRKNERGNWEMVWSLCAKSGC